MPNTHYPFSIFSIIVFLMGLLIQGSFQKPASIPSNLTSIQTEENLIANRRFRVHRRRRIPIPRGEGDTNKSIPYIISPRATLLLSRNPVILWNEVSPGSQNYDVAVLDITDDSDKTIIWSATYDSNRVCINQVCSTILPETLDLRPGRDYLVKVISDAGKFDKSPGISFRLVSSEEAALILDERNTIEEEALSTNSTALMIADLYVQHSLFSEAIQILEKVPESQRTAKTNLEIARNYQRIGLVNTAAIFYETALELATTELDDKVVADAKFGLGLVSLSLRERQQAVDYLIEAKNIYEQLEDLYFLGETLFALRDATRAIGQLEEADDWLEEAIGVYKSLITELENNNAASDLTAEAYSNLGDVYSLLSEHTEAISAYERAMSLYSEIGDLETATEFEKIISDLQSEL